MKDYAELLQSLADKFGTTVEHLWGALVKQAAISASLSLITSCLLVVCAIALFKFIQKKTVAPEHAYAEWREEGAFIAWASFAIFSTLSFTIVIGSLDIIAAGFLNPEYWALMQIKG